MTLTGRTLLVVDDNPLSREVVSQLLNARGYEVLTAGDGAEALALLERENVDLVFMDVEMPVLDGLEATRRIRADERFSGLPIIGLTAHMDDTEARQAGMNDAVLKPTRVARLDAVCQLWLGGVTREAAESPASPAPASEAGPQPWFERTALLEALEGDEEFLTELLGLYLDDLPRQLGELARVVLRADHDAVRRRAHSIKGASANVHAPAMRECAQRLEQAGEDARLDLYPEIHRELLRCWESTREELAREIA